MALKEVTDTREKFSVALKGVAEEIAGSQRLPVGLFVQVYFSQDANPILIELCEDDLNLLTAIGTLDIIKAEMTRDVLLASGR